MYEQRFDRHLHAVADSEDSDLLFLLISTLDVTTRCMPLAMVSVQWSRADAELYSLRIESSTLNAFRQRG